MLKKLLLAPLFCFFFISCETLSNLPAATSITEQEAAEGIRQALDQGVNRGISTLHVQDGFFGNLAYKILLPPDAKRVENTLRDLGMSGMVDKAILQINRAAEDAVGFARPIFTEAITGMTIMDAINIVTGSDTAATQYFRQKTSDKLVAAFSPVIKQALDKFEATKYYADVINTYNRFPTTLNKINPDLPSYVVDRAVSALFDEVAKEEEKIREDPVARTTEILKKVFGYAARR